MHVNEETIAAIATAPGAAGLAVVRLSGPAAFAIGDAVFRGAHRLAETPGSTLRHGWAVDAEGARVDEVVAAVFRAPHSYTREDMVEFGCHGGAMPARRLLEALLAASALPARPGEFTLRAFLNGRVDLAQAEAVADVIHAETRAAHDLALSQLAGELSARLGVIEEALRDARAEVEARVDFAEDVGGIEVPAHVIAAIGEAAGTLDALLRGAAFARAVRDGLRVPIVGRPNVGKSSLFNALIGEERAIVTALPGTTRDRLSETIELAGVRVTLSDTAGLRDSDEPVEAIGVTRTRSLVDESSVVVWVVDAAAPLDSEDAAIAARLAGKRVLVALNKSDLPARVCEAEVAHALGGESVGLGAGGGVATARPAAVAPATFRAVAVSALRGTGVEAFRDALIELAGGGAAGAVPGDGPAVSNPRHVESLERAHASFGRAAAAGRSGAPGEIVALELREGLEALGEVTGRGVSDDLLERIFNRFCVGK